MIAGLLLLKIRLFSVDSLKVKRSIMHKIKERTKNKFNVSIAETGDNDNLHYCTLGISTVGNDSKFINSSLDNVFSFINSMMVGEIYCSSFEIVHMKSASEDRLCLQEMDKKYDV